MKEKIRKLLKDKRGSGTFIEMAVLILVVLMMLALSISFLQIYARHKFAERKC